MAMPVIEPNDLQDPQLMEEAHAYAQAAMEDPEMKAYYEEKAKTNQMSPYQTALYNYFELQRRMRE
jgi:hypothetical protein